MREAFAASRAAYDALRNPPPPPPDPGLVATFKVSFAELGAAGEDAPTDLYRALRDMARRTGGGMFAPRGPVVDFIRALAASAKGLERIEVKVRGMSREECINVRGILSAAAMRASLDNVAQPSVLPLRNLVLAWERFANVRTNDPRSPAEARQAWGPIRDIN